MLPVLAQFIDANAGMIVQTVALLVVIIVAVPPMLPVIMISGVLYVFQVRATDRGALCICCVFQLVDTLCSGGTRCKTTLLPLNCKAACAPIPATERVVQMATIVPPDDCTEYRAGPGLHA